MAVHEIWDISSFLFFISFEITLAYVWGDFKTDEK